MNPFFLETCSRLPPFIVYQYKTFVTFSNMIFVDYHGLIKASAATQSFENHKLLEPSENFTVSIVIVQVIEKV